MERKSIDIRKFLVQPHDIIEYGWMLLCAGNFRTGRFNMMTIGWGSFGTMWSKPLAMVAVRPTRYTFRFMEEGSDFTLSVFPAEYRETLGVIGSKSGRDMDKIHASGLTPVASKLAEAPSFAEAILSIECRKNYWQDLDPTHFLDAGVHKQYPLRDYHRIYFGEVLYIEGIDKFSF